MAVKLTNVKHVNNKELDLHVLVYEIPVFESRKKIIMSAVHENQSINMVKIHGRTQYNYMLQREQITIHMQIPQCVIIAVTF